MVSTSTAGCGWAAQMREVALAPPPPGMRRSISTTSGRQLATASMAASPSLTAPTQEAGRLVQDGLQPGQEDGMVIGDDDPYRARTGPILGRAGH